MSPPEPILLLKTQSGPNDAYLELFSKPHGPSGSRHFSPSFVPVLRHHFRDEEMDRVRSLLRDRKISRAEDAAFGGMIFTSQRAVEAFASLVEEGKDGKLAYRQHDRSCADDLSQMKIPNGLIPRTPHSTALVRLLPVPLPTSRPIHRFPSMARTLAQAMSSHPSFLTTTARSIPIGTRNPRFCFSLVRLAATLFPRRSWTQHCHLIRG